MRITGTGIWGEPADPDEARRVLRRAVELGVNFIDTAVRVRPRGQRTADRRDARAVPGRSRRRDEGRAPAQRAQPWHPDGTARDTIRRECERSLSSCARRRSISTSCTGPIRGVPLEESLGTIVDLQREGKVRMIGISQRQRRRAARGAQTVTEIVSVQNRASFGDRSSDDVLAICERDGIAFLPWAPLDGGA